MCSLAIPALLLHALAPQGLGALPLDGARDLTGEGLVAVRVEALVEEGRSVWAGERVPLAIVVEVDRELLETRLLQPFQRALDLPVQVEAAWLGELEPIAPRPGSGDDAPGTTLALGTSIVAADRVDRPGGRIVATLVRALAAPRAGTLELGAPTARFAYAETFREDLLRGRVPGERFDAYVRGEPLALAVRPLPEDGRPPGFTGAVGRFEARASVDRSRVHVGESLTLELRIEGEGDLDAFEPPRLAPTGFDVRGTLDGREPGARVVRYDLAPRSTAAAVVPPVPFAFFDPSRGAYRVVETEAIELAVDPAPSAAQEPGDGTGERDPAYERGEGDERRLPLGPLALGGLTALVLVLGLAIARRGRG